MKRLLKAAIIVASTLLSYNTIAQQDAQFSHYMFNSLYLNPGNAGIEGMPKFTFLARNQWTGYNGTGGGAPQGQLFTASMPILAIKSGIGLQIMNDQLGPMRNVDIQVSFSKHLELGGGKLGLGIRGGVFNKSNNAVYKFTDAGDGKITDLDNQSVSGLNPDFALGAWYDHKNWYLGASVNHLVEFEFKDVNTKLQNHFYGTAGYKYQLSAPLLLTPSVLVKSDANKVSYELSAMLTYNSKFWGGISFRQQDAIIPFIGLSMLKNNALKFGYAFDWTIVNANGKAPGSHEIMLSYSLPQVLPVVKPVIRTPRYRF